MKLALFDFDGTISSKDSFIDFIAYAVGRTRLLAGLILLSPVLLSYILKIVPNWKAKEIVLTYFFKGWPEERFEYTASQYSRGRLLKLIKNDYMEKINRHKAQGHKVAVVTASVDYWLNDWCKLNGLDLISTTLEVRNGKLTGKISGRNCYGIEKVNRIKDKYDLAEFEQIYAYGNSRGDREMLLLAETFGIAGGNGSNK
jgi:phosphatidylglycerophosphatase C